jgi:hypothetical protein
LGRPLVKMPDKIQDSHPWQWHDLIKWNTICPAGVQIIFLDCPWNIWNNMEQYGTIWNMEFVPI